MLRTWFAFQATRCVATAIVGIMLFGVSPSAAQDTQDPQDPPDAALTEPIADQPASLFDQATRFTASSMAQTPGEASWLAENRACEGCPRRSVGRALFQTTIINVFYGVANLVRGQVTARITPKTWWDNMEQGWVWDLDDFTVNQIGHPYQGNNYFTAGRANGLSFYESAAVTAFGSATWEYFGETNHASLERLHQHDARRHRARRDVPPHRVAGARHPGNRDAGACGARSGRRSLDPITGGESLLQGGRRARHRQAAPTWCPRTWPLSGAARRAVARHARQRVHGDRAALPRGRRDLRRSARRADSRTPYDAFGVRLRFGGGIGLQRGHGPRPAARPAASSEQRRSSPSCRATTTRRTMPTPPAPSRSRGRSGSRSTLSSTHPDVGARLGRPHRPRRHRFAAARRDRSARGGGGEEEPETRAGRLRGAALLRLRPGRQFRRDRAVSPANDRPFATFFYEGRHLYSLDGVRANHFLQRGRIDLLVPLQGALGLGVTGEYFDRRTFYQDAGPQPRQLPLPAAAHLLHVEGLVSLSIGAWVRGLCLALAPVLAFAQAAPQAPSSQPDDGPSKLWLVAGGARRRHRAADRARHGHRVLVRGPHLGAGQRRAVRRRPAAKRSRPIRA